MEMKRDFYGALDVYNAAMRTDPSNTYYKEGLNRAQNFVIRSEAGENVDPSSNATSWIEDPELASVLSDPSVKQVMADLVANPAAAQVAMNDPLMAKKVQRLLLAGIIKQDSS
mmetsp:Transcript_24634/g.27420  ORF Transcript_24634/g.27420 Transcript_24634/m.27420 type:complete len:113 (-) Transcript_24634:188-526(-)